MFLIIIIILTRDIDGHFELLKPKHAREEKIEPEKTNIQYPIQYPTEEKELESAPPKEATK